MTCGPYRPIRLLTYTTRILDLYPHVSIPGTVSFSPNSSSSGAELTANLRITGDRDAVETTRVVLHRAGFDIGENPDMDELKLMKGIVVRSETIKHGYDVFGFEEGAARERRDSVIAGDEESKDIELINWIFEPGEVELWWPVGFGSYEAPCLYELDVALFDKVSCLASFAEEWCRILQ